MAPKKESASKTKTSVAASATYEIRDIVLGKIKGFPAWPGIVVDPDSPLPEVVKDEQPKAQKTVSYCVRFFPKGDYAWLTAKDISRLLPHEIDAFLNDTKKSPMLKEGYEIAKNPEPWEKEVSEALEGDEQEDAEEDAMEVDELDEEGGKGKAKKKPAAAATKKRKRDAEPTKKSTTKKPAAPKKARGAKGKKSKETIESDDDGDAEGDADEEEPESKKAKKESDDPQVQSVKDWRHKLQKGFLNFKDKITPGDKDLVTLDALMKTVEEYDGMTLDQLTVSKIGKVMRHIAALPDDKIPQDDVYHFRTRSDVLVQKWSKILNPKGEANGTTNGMAVDIEPLSAIP